MSAEGTAPLVPEVLPATTDEFPSEPEPRRQAVRALKDQNRDPRAYCPKRRCNARAKQTGKQCRAWAQVGSTKCRHHGGTQARHIAPGAMPYSVIGERLEELLKDREGLTNLHRDAALLTVAVEDLLQSGQVPDMQGIELIRRVADTKGKLIATQAKLSEDADAVPVEVVQQLLRHLTAAINREVPDAPTRRALMESIAHFSPE